MHYLTYSRMLSAIRTIEATAPSAKQLFDASLVALASTLAMKIFSTVEIPIVLRKLDSIRCPISKNYGIRTLLRHDDEIILIRRFNCLSIQPEDEAQGTQGTSSATGQRHWREPWSLLVLPFFAFL